MEFLSFFGGVWASIIFGLFVIAMVIGCTFDRHYTESPKWWIFLAALVTLCIWKWNPERPWSETWSMIWSREIWSYVGWYFLIGVVYAVLEFMLDVRRSARFWSKKWREYKAASMQQTERLRETAERKRKEAELRNKKVTDLRNAGDLVEAPISSPPDVLGAMTGTQRRESETLEELQAQPDFDYNTASSTYNKALVKDFLTRNGMDSHYRYRIVGVEASKEGGIEPKVNRQQLAESVGVWIMFWPFYAISLIIGDLVTEIFRFIADMLVQMSGRFVRNAFKDVFKFGSEA